MNSMEFKKKKVFINNILKLYIFLKKFKEIQISTNQNFLFSKVLKNGISHLKDYLFSIFFHF